MNAFAGRQKRVFRTADRKMPGFPKQFFGPPTNRGKPGATLGANAGNSEAHKLDSDDESAYTTEFLDGEKSTLRGEASRNERY